MIRQGLDLDRREAYLIFLLQGAIVAIMLAGATLRSARVVVNAAMALAVTLLPAYLARSREVHLGPRITVVVVLAVFLHSVGMLAFYRTVWWWDHLTHLLSASLVASVGYAAVVALDDYSAEVRFPPTFRVAFVVLLTIGLGVLWEVFEFLGREALLAVRLDPLLIQYGIEDTILDLVFDTLGAIVVALFVRHRLGGLSETIRTRILG